MTLTPSYEAPLLLIGCGNMGGALMRGWLAQTPPPALWSVDPERHGAAGLDGMRDGQALASTAQLPEGFRPRVVVLGVKPQTVTTVMPGLLPVLTEQTLIISIAAGVTLGKLQQLTAGHARVVRAMPNTPVAVGQGVSGLIAAAGVSADDKEVVTDLMQAVGQAVWIQSEAQFDALTALSGSGPAYVFHMVEAMAGAGEALGLDAGTAMLLARQTIVGAGALLARDADIPADELRRRVTSPGGTTAEALAVLMRAEGLQALMTQAVAAARNRAVAMASDAADGG